MIKFDLQLHNGLPIITDILGHKLLLDTGSPSSFCETSQINIFGDPIRTPRNLMGQVNAEYLISNLKIHLDGLLGLDILKMKSFSINYQELSFTIFDEMPVRNDLHRFPDSSFFKIPVQITGNIVNLILDTGAHISYLNPELVNVDTLNLRKTTDFNPILGNFEVSLVDNFSYTINEIQLDHEIGLAPSNLANMLRQMSVGGVFGYELFKVIDFYYFKEENNIAISML
jgi:hypothetical protein